MATAVRQSTVQNVVQYRPVDLTKEQRDKNIDAIRSFSENDFQIRLIDKVLKVVHKINLYVVDIPNPISRIRGRVYGWSLVDALPTIVKTFDMVFDEFDTLYQAAEKNVAVLNALCERELDLMQGLYNIRNVYADRYVNERNHPGLHDLHTFYEVAAERMKGQFRQYGYWNETVEQWQIDRQKEKRELQALMQSEETKQKAEAAKKLDVYCEKYCQISEEKATRMILKGRSLMRKIFTENVTRTPTQEDIAHLTWFFMDCAVKKNQGFEEGSFIIEDRSFLFNFMEQIAYQRSSSHFIGRSPKYPSFIFSASLHHAIDVTNGKMPAKKQTVIFERVKAYNSGPKDPKPLFFKPENYGTQGANSFIKHMIEWVGSIFRRRSKGSNERAGMQKERVPDDANDEFVEFKQYLEQNIHIYQPILNQLAPRYHLSNALHEAKKWGIAYIFDFVKTLEQKIKEVRVEYLDEFNEAAAPLTALLMSLDNREKRTGNEVYITQEELLCRVFGELNEAQKEFEAFLRYLTQNINSYKPILEKLDEDFHFDKISYNAHKYGLAYLGYFINTLEEKIELREDYRKVADPLKEILKSRGLVT